VTNAIDDESTGANSFGVRMRSSAPSPTVPAIERQPPFGISKSVWTGIFYVALLLYVALASSHQRGFIFDDPFIFFRYARNLANGHGWVYNIGQPGYDAATSPLYVLILAAAYKLGVNLVFASGLVFVGGLAGCACLTHATLARLNHWWAGIAAACLIASSPWLFITRGMETALFIGVFALCLYLWVSGATYGLGASLAALVLIRPDGIVLVVLIIAAKWMIDRQPPRRTLIVGAVIAAIWAVYALVAVGSILPDTLAAKIAQGRSGFFGRPFWKGVWWVPIRQHFGIVEAIVTLLGIVGIFIAAMRPELRLVLGVIAAASAITFVAYSLLTVPDYTWYYAPLVYLSVILAALTIEEIGRLASRHHVGLVALPVVVVLILIVVGLNSTEKGPPRPGYEQAAVWINEHTAPSATVTSAEIGLLGWYTNHPMKDYDGLLTPNALGPLERGDMTWWVNGLRPDYWMVPRPHFLEDLPVLQAPWFSQVFHEVYANRHVIIYRRIALAP